MSLAPRDDLLVDRLSTDDRLHTPDFWTCAACVLITRIEASA